MTDTTSNPLMADSALPFGIPDFAAIKVEHFEPAVLAGIKAELEDWERIATNPEVPDADNTVAAVDRAGQLLMRAISAFWTMSSSIGGSEYDALQEKLAPLLSEHHDDFFTNEALYERYAALKDSADLDAETGWLVAKTLSEFERSGVNLNPKGKEKLRQLNRSIATFESQIDAKISKQLVECGLSGDDLADLDGLSPEEIERAKAEGEKRGRVWHLGVDNFSVPSYLLSLRDARTRKLALDASLNRVSTVGTDVDTRAQIIELARLRAKRAKLLGFSSHAEIVMDAETVPSPTEARDLLRTVGNAAVCALESEAEIYRKEAAKDDIELTASDWPVYEDRARLEQLGVDSSSLKEYFDLERVVRDGIFFAANRLYGLSFQERPDIVGWSPETKSWEVLDEDGSTIGLFMADYYNRPGKSGGAWMSELESGSRRSGRLPVITNDANFKKPADGGPTLLSWDNVETVFHEFGHALHGLLTATYYESTAGANVPRDFVELPSQLNEMWAFHPEVLGRYARHWETGDPLPDAVRESLVNSKHFGQPYATLEYVQAAIVDQAWHDDSGNLPGEAEGVDAFEASALAEAEMAHPLVVPRYRTPYFSHAFAGGYDAGYYSYMWAEAMVGELEEWFRSEAAKNDDGGLNREAGQKLRDELLSRGNSRDPLASFIAVRGRAPEGVAVIRRRGLEENVNG